MLFVRPHSRPDVLVSRGFRVFRPVGHELLGYTFQLKELANQIVSFIVAESYWRQVILKALLGLHEDLSLVSWLLAWFGIQVDLLAIADFEGRPHGALLVLTGPVLQ